MNPASQRLWRELGLQIDGVPAAWPAGPDSLEATPAAAPAVAAPAPAPAAQRARGPVAVPSAPPAPMAPVADAARARHIASLALAPLQAELAGCTACALHAGRQQVVGGLVVPGAPWLFVGEAPGVEDDQSGQPFSGPGGLLLDAMLAALGLQRGRDVSLLTVVRCRPPAGRAPSAAECASCLPWLQRQLTLLRPRVVVALGKTASQQVLGSEFNLGSLRGKVHLQDGMAAIATYHPDYLLRNPVEKARTWSDLCLARRTLDSGQS